MAVKNKGKWGFVDSKGKVQIACKYAEVQEFHYVNGLSLVKDGNRSFYVDCSGTEYYAN
nr:WG repeat-containing protein [Chitinophaga chungangae]